MLLAQTHARFFSQLFIFFFLFFCVKRVEKYFLINFLVMFSFRALLLRASDSLVPLPPYIFFYGCQDVSFTFCAKKTQNGTVKKKHKRKLINFLRTHLNLSMTFNFWYFRGTALSKASWKMKIFHFFSPL